MKATVSKYLEILIESVNYIIINYALSNMALLFRSNPLFIAKALGAATAALASQSVLQAFRILLPLPL